MAQEPLNQENSNPDEQKTEEQKKAEYEQKMAEIRKATAVAEKEEAEAEAATFKAKWGGSNTKGLKGTITIDSAGGYYAEYLAYEVVDKIAKEISDRVSSELQTGELIILGAEDVKAEAAFWNLLDLRLDATTRMVENDIQKYSEMVKAYSADSLSKTEGTASARGVVGAVPAILGATPTILGAVADIVAFFKSNHSITGREVILNEQAVKAAAAKHIKESCAELSILLPELFITGAGTLYSKYLKLSDRFEELKEKKDSIVNELDKLPEKYVDEQENARRSIIEPMEADIKAVEAFLSTLVTKTDNKLSPLESVATIDIIHLHKDAKILRVLITSQGGEVETSESSFSRARISYLGGAVITYFLSNTDGTLVNSGYIQEIKTASYKSIEGITTLNKK